MIYFFIPFIKNIYIIKNNNKRGGARAGYPCPGFGTGVGESFLNRVEVGLGRTRSKPNPLPSLLDSCHSF